MKRKSSSQEKYDKELNKSTKNDQNDENKKTKLVHWEPLAEYEVSSRENDVFYLYTYYIIEN